jgi:hypothetical protein
MESWIMTGCVGVVMGSGRERKGRSRVRSLASIARVKQGMPWMLLSVNSRSSCRAICQDLDVPTIVSTVVPHGFVPVRCGMCEGSESTPRDFSSGCSSCDKTLPPFQALLMVRNGD